MKAANASGRDDRTDATHVIILDYLGGFVDCTSGFRGMQSVDIDGAAQPTGQPERPGEDQLAFDHAHAAGRPDVRKCCGERETRIVMRFP